MRRTLGMSRGCDLRLERIRAPSLVVQARAKPGWLDENFARLHPQRTVQRSSCQDIPSVRMVLVPISSISQGYSPLSHNPDISNLSPASVRDTMDNDGGESGIITCCWCRIPSVRACCGCSPTVCGPRDARLIVIVFLISAAVVLIVYFSTA